MGGRGKCHSWPNGPTVFVLFLWRHEYATFVPDIRVDACNWRARIVNVVWYSKSHYFGTHKISFKKKSIKQFKTKSLILRFLCDLLYMLDINHPKKKKRTFSAGKFLKRVTTTCDRRF